MAPGSSFGESKGHASRMSMFRPTVTSDIQDWFSTALLVTGGLGVAAITAAAVAASWVNHDAGWYLHMAGAWPMGVPLTST